MVRLGTVYVTVVAVLLGIAVHVDPQLDPVLLWYS